MDDLTKLHGQVREHVRERARRAFAAGMGRDEHGMNPGSAAIKDFQAEWDMCFEDAQVAEIVA